MKVYITKYALTDGISEREVTEAGNNLVCDASSGYKQYFHTEGKDWHLTKESAIKRSYEMRDKRVKALEKQLEKLKKITF